MLLAYLLSGQAQAVNNNTVESKFRLLILGDSLTAGYGLPMDASFPVQLEHALNNACCEVLVINAGISGDTSAGGLSRLEWVLELKPDFVVLELGGNDALRGLPPEETFNNLEAIIERLKQTGIPVLLAGMQAPENMGRDFAEEFNAIYPKLAQKHEIPLYPFFLEGVALNPELNQADGIHPNESGVAEIVRRILPKLQEELKKHLTQINNLNPARLSSKLTLISAHF